MMVSAAIGYLQVLSLMSLHRTPFASSNRCDTIERFGTKQLSEVLQPAAELADGGWPVSLFTSVFWRKWEQQLLAGGPHGGDLLVEGIRGPREGEIMRNPKMGDTLRELMSECGGGALCARCGNTVDVKSS